LVAQAKQMSEGDKQTQNPIDLDGDHGWSVYLNSLKKTGYFKVWCTVGNFLILLGRKGKEFMFLFQRANIYYLQIHRKMVTAGTNLFIN
jgi:restriction endonuclease S subunit